MIVTCGIRALLAPILQVVINMQLYCIYIVLAFQIYE